MTKERLAAFTDGVIAVVITIMVLELKSPGAPSLSALLPLAPTFLSYVLSFIYVAIYWTNHHHFFSLVRSVNGAILWANVHLLFWLSLVPFTTAWLGANPTGQVPTAIYGVSLLMPALAWYLMQWVIIRHQGKDSPLARTLGADLKGKLSPVLYLAGIGFAFVSTWVADVFYVAVALMWLTPDTRIERRLGKTD